MKFRVVTNRKPPQAFLHPADVKRWQGYHDGQRTLVYLANGRRMHLDVTPEEFEAAFTSEQQANLRRGLERALASRAEHEKAHPEFADFWPLLDGLLAAIPAEEEAES